MCHSSFLLGTDVERDDGWNGDVFVFSGASYMRIIRGV